MLSEQWTVRISEQGLLAVHIVNVPTKKIFPVEILKFYLVNKIRTSRSLTHHG